MSQHLVGDLDIDPNVTSGTELSDILDRLHDAFITGHSGATRPPYAKAGLIWVDSDESPAKVYFYDGTTDIELGGVTPGGTAEQVLAKVDAVDGNVYWKTLDLSGGGGGGLTWQVNQQVDFEAVPGEGYPVTGGVIMTLPATPSNNDQCGWKDYENNFDVVPCYIDPNGNAIEQFAAGEVMTLDTKGQGGTLVWIDDRWLITDVTEIGTEKTVENQIYISEYGPVTSPSSSGGITSVTLDKEYDLSKSFIVPTCQPLYHGATLDLKFRFNGPQQVDIIAGQAGHAYNTITFQVVEDQRIKRIQQVEGSQSANTTGQYPLPIAINPQQSMINQPRVYIDYGIRGRGSYSIVDELNVQVANIGPDHAHVFLLDIIEYESDFVTYTEVAGQGVKLVQHYTGNIGANSNVDIPITAVDLTKTFISMNWQPGEGGFTRLKDASTVEIRNDVGSTLAYAFDVIEFF